MADFEGIVNTLEDDTKSIFTKKISIGGHEIPLVAIIVGGIGILFAITKLSGNGIGALSPSGSVPTGLQGSAGLSGSSDSVSGQSTQDAQTGFSQQLSDLSQGFSDQLTTTQESIAQQTNDALDQLQNQVTQLQNQPLPQDTNSYALNPLPSDFVQGTNPYGDNLSVPLNGFAGDNLYPSLPVNYPTSPIVSRNTEINPIRPTIPVKSNNNGNANKKGFLQNGIRSTQPINSAIGSVIEKGFLGFKPPTNPSTSKSGNAITNSPNFSGLINIPKNNPLNTNPLINNFIRGVNNPSPKPVSTPKPLTNPYSSGFFNPISIAPRPTPLPPAPSYNPYSGGFFNPVNLSPKPTPTPTPTKSGNATINSGLNRLFG